MAKLLIRTKDKYNDLNNEDKYLSKRCFEGDVICVIDDSHVFSESEQNASDKIILELPGINKSNLKKYIEVLYDDTIGPDKSIIKKRRYMLDLENLDIEKISYLENEEVLNALRIAALNVITIDKSK